MYTVKTQRKKTQMENLLAASRVTVVHTNISVEILVKGSEPYVWYVVFLQDNYKFVANTCHTGSKDKKQK